MFKIYYSSPIGDIELVSDGKYINELDFVAKSSVINGKGELLPNVLQETLYQLDLYFKGKLERFTVPLLFLGTNFQKKVWHSLLSIQYGQVISYKQLAQRVGSSFAYQAVGQANKKNKLPILIPCHRVINTNGSLGGYDSEVWRKKWLLGHEKKFL